MTLEDLRVFVAVCQAGSFSAVARELGCTQPAVSQHVARLERELDTALLERSSTGVTPTSAGQSLRVAAMDGLDAIATGVAHVAEMRDGEVGALAITTGGTTVRHFMRGSVVRFRKRHPGVQLQFLPADSTQDCLEVLRRGDADLALVTIGETIRGIEQRTVARQEPRLLVRSDDPMARRKRVRIRELAGLPYIGLSAQTTSARLIARAFAEESVSLEPNMIVDDFDTACVFVELGLGLAIVPAMQAHNFARDHRVTSVHVQGLAPVPIGWAARRWSALSSVAEAFVEVFRRELGKQAAVPGLTLVD